jgi:hypothetical protein
MYIHFQETDPHTQGVMPKKDKTLVYFYGTQKCGWVSRDCAKNFSDNVGLVSGKFQEQKNLKSKCQFIVTLYRVNVIGR